MEAPSLSVLGILQAKTLCFIPSRIFAAVEKGLTLDWDL